jgi:hypothetical protein
VTGDQPAAPTMALPRPGRAPRSPANRRGVSQEGSGKDLVSCVSTRTAPKSPDTQVATHNQPIKPGHKINR